MTESRIITVRCAHQKQNDFSVEAQLNWTVRELKQHLHDVYPSNPEADHQRLIYAGQMMKDEQTIREYLKRLPITDTPVVHLVFTHKFVAPSPSVENESLRRRKFTAPNPQAASILRRTSDANTEALPNFASFPNSAPFPMAQSTPNFINHPTVGFPNIPFNSFGGHADLMFGQAQLINHPAAAYMNQYLQYLQQVYGVNPNNFYWPMYGGLPQYGGVGAVNPASQQQAPPSNEPQQQAPVNQPAPVAAQQPQMAMNAQGGLEDAEEGGRNDWLDWVYTFCRASLLFVILFSYSSMERLTFVMFICFLFFAYHNGWFAARRNQRNAQPAAERLANDNNNNRIRRENGAQVAAGEPGADHADTPAETDPNSSLDPNASAWHVFWSTCYTFFSSFFASLIPERAPPLNF